MGTIVKLRVLPDDICLNAESGEKLSDVLRREGLLTDSYCGGQGRCGKCAVLINGEKQLACRVTVNEALTVEIPGRDDAQIVTDCAVASFAPDPVKPGHVMAFDIGTTTVVGSLMDASGTERAVFGALNPQTAYGADVVSRIRSAVGGTLAEQSRLIRARIGEIAAELCRSAGIDPKETGTVCVVGNPAMQQIFFGLSVSNLIEIPFSPVLRRNESFRAAEYIPALENAVLITPPDVSGYVGADTTACVLSSGLYAEDELTLLVDIGTNGEMVLGNRERMLCCSTAAGPALEGANIKFGMRASEGAIDRVYAEDGRLRCSVIGGGEAKGICGSGLIDAVAAALELGLINRRGKIISGDALALCDGVFLTQDDIREFQLAKGAIAAGIDILAAEYGTQLDKIGRVLLAGAFGSRLNVESACRTGLIPGELRNKALGIGNAALTGAKLAALRKDDFALMGELARSMELVELASLPEFRRCFAKNMYFY